MYTLFFLRNKQNKAPSGQEDMSGILLNDGVSIINYGKHTPHSHDLLILIGLFIYH